MRKLGPPVLLLLVVCSTIAWSDGMLIPGPIHDIIPDEPYFTIKYHHVKCEIHDQVATTYVDQVFVNEGRREMEATYLFPLPAGAVVNKFTLYADGKEIEARLLDKDEARRIYENIVRRRRDPALLTYAGNGAYEARLFPIPPGGERRVELRYSEILQFDNGLITYLYPLSPEQFTSRPIKSVVFTADIYSGTPIGAVYSPTHDMAVTKLDENHVRVSYEENDTKPDRDILLYYNVANGPVGMNAIFFKEPNHDGFYLLLAAPTVEQDTTRVQPKDVCFVLDTSGSMSGKKIEQAKQALTFCVNSLNRKDRFNIIAFSDTTRAFRDDLVPAARDTVAAARQFIAGLQARGGTDIDTALRQALDGSPAGTAYYVVFLTDGRPTVGEQNPDTILQNVTKQLGERSTRTTRIFTFGVGYDVNTHFLDKLSGNNGGVTVYVREGEDIEVKVSNFYEKISQPILTKLQVDYGRVKVYDSFPRQLPDLFRGSQLTILGRYKDETARRTTLRLTGETTSGPQHFELNTQFPDSRPDTDYIAALWAARKIGYLLDQIRLHGEKKELVDEVVRLSREYGILTEYTAFLAEEPRAIPLAEAQERAAGNVRAAAAPGMSMGAGGPGGVSGAQNVQTLKAQAQVAFNQYLDAQGKVQHITNVQQVGQRGFVNRQGRWEDLRYEPHMDIELKIKAYSEAYFQLSRAFPTLNKQLALGDNLIVIINGHAIQIGPEGKTRLTDEEINALRTPAGAEQTAAQALRHRNWPWSVFVALVQVISRVLS